MAMMTTLQMVSAGELEALLATPTSINRLDKPGEASGGSYYGCAISFFLVGDAYPSYEESGPLAATFSGSESVSCSSLENGEFGVARPDVVAEIAAALDAVDLDAFRDRVATADHAELVEEEELFDLELLLADDEDVAQTLLDDLAAVTAFYQRAAARNLAVVSYTG